MLRGSLQGFQARRVLPGGCVGRSTGFERYVCSASIDWSSQAHMQRALAAVEADIRRLLPLVPYWPSHLSGIEDALVHVDSVARWKGFTYTRFEGVEQERFRRYVKFNTVRHAYEDGRFDMKAPGEDWRCRHPKGSKAPVGKLATMNGTPSQYPAHCARPTNSLKQVPSKATFKSSSPASPHGYQRSLPSTRLGTTLMISRAAFISHTRTGRTSNQIVTD